MAGTCCVSYIFMKSLFWYQLCLGRGPWYPNLNSQKQAKKTTKHQARNKLNAKAHEVIVVSHGVSELLQLLSVRHIQYAKPQIPKSHILYLLTFNRRLCCGTIHHHVSKFPSVSPQPQELCDLWSKDTTERSSACSLCNTAQGAGRQEAEVTTRRHENLLKRLGELKRGHSSWLRDIKILVHSREFKEWQVTRLETSTCYHLLKNSF